MTIGTEELIVQAVERLLMQKKVKKLTVKDIVEECGITRQTFYYHFRDIPDLLKWVLERNTDQLLKETLAQGNAEKGLRCLFLLALNTRPYVEHGLRTNYRDEITRMVEEQLFTFFLQVGGKARPVRPMQSLGVKARYALSQSGGSWHPQELVRGRQR